MKICIVKSCKLIVKCRGWCRKHYAREYYSRGLKVQKRIPRNGCNVEGCGGKHKAFGYCRKHYLRLTPQAANARERSRNWHRNNRERSRANTKNWKLRHPERSAYLTLKRQLAIRAATPSWVDTLAIEFFNQCCPEGLVVDHIIPIQGTNVCGLNIIENLQYLTPAQNALKRHKFPYEVQQA